MNNTPIRSSRWSSLRGVLVCVSLVLGVISIPAVAGADPLASPNAPTNVTVGPYTQGNNFVQVNWVGSTLANPQVSLYTVTSSPGALTCTTNGALLCSVQNLVAGTSYTFSVRATNIQGTSPASANSPNFTPTQLPGPVGNLTASYTQGNSYFSVNWTAPTVGWPAPASYMVTLNPGGSSQTLSGTTTTASFTNLTAGTAYTVSVAAVNLVGTGPASNSQPVTITQLPGAVGNPTAGYVTGSPGITVSWSVPSTGYPAPSSYTVTSSPVSTTCVSSSTTCSFTTLTPGQTYTFSITATNSVGTGPSATSNSVLVKNPPQAPGTPTFPALKANTTKVTLSWSPSSDCGSGCTYSVLVNGTKFSSTGSTHLIVTGLVYGTSYTFSVTATSTNGTSNPSNTSKVAVAWRTLLRVGTSLLAGQRLYSANHSYYLEILPNGHLGVARGSITYWSAPGGTGTNLSINSTGNVVFSNNGARVWSTKTSLGRGSWILEISSAGNRYIYNGSRLVWRSNGGLVRAPVRKPPVHTPPVKHPVTTTTVHHTPPTTTTTVPGIPIP